MVCFCRCSWQSLKLILKDRLISVSFVVMSGCRLVCVSQVLHSGVFTKHPKDNEELAKQLPEMLDKFERYFFATATLYLGVLFFFFSIVHLLQFNVSVSCALNQTAITSTDTRT